MLPSSGRTGNGFPGDSEPKVFFSQRQYIHTHCALAVSRDKEHDMIEMTTHSVAASHLVEVSASRRSKRDLQAALLTLARCNLAAAPGH